MITFIVHHGFDNDGNVFINLGLRMDNIAYISDVNHIPKETRKKLANLELLILDALQRKLDLYWQKRVITHQKGS
jgi:phosphoribosyl 1,2-cyclic phosphodiesterase